MASAVLNIIGMVAGVASLVPFAEQFFAPDDAKATTVQVMLGTSNEDGQSFGGNTPGASLWNFKGDAIGHTPGTSEIVPQGNPIQIKINPRADVGAIQAEYLSISNGGNDAICIAGISVTFPDGAKAGFSTNVAASCGAAFWSNSRTPVVNQPISGELDPPKCVWIDRDGSNGIPHQGIGIHLPSFSSSNVNLAAEYAKNSDFMCKSGPRFRMYPQLKTEDSILVFDPPLEFVTSQDDPSLVGTDKDLTRIINNPGVLADNLITGAAGSGSRRRDLTRRGRHHQESNFSNSTAKPNDSQPPVNQLLANNPLATRVIISPLEFNSARELCESETSYGQSFAALAEGLFCDMTDKSLYFTCTDKVTTCCFDDQAASFRACQSESTRPPTTKQTAKFPPGRLRARQAGDELDPAWTKTDKTYEHVRRW